MKALATMGVILGWLLVIYGALAAVASLPVLYMLAAGKVRPGEPYFMDELAPTTQEAAVAAAIACGALAAGFIVKALCRRWLRRG